MERYHPKATEEVIHPVVGNLYLARSIEDALDSYPFRREDIEGAERGVRERRIIARLALSENAAGFPGFVYIHAAKHSKEEHPLRRRRIPIFDHMGDSAIIDVPIENPFKRT